jgi:pimeloyl-ACP methyl ester carboxylesterase
MPRTRTVRLRPDLTVTLTEAGAGRTALILHGGGGPVTVQSIAAHVSGTMHVITPTHPGWDGTERPGWLAGVTGLALAYLQLLKDEGHRDVLVIGSSIGGWIGAEMAVHDDGLITGLVLIDSAGVLIDGQPMLDFFALDARGVAEYSYHDPDRFYVDPATIPPGQAALRAANMATLRVLAGDPYMHDPDLLGRLGQVKIPVLVLWGDSDRIFTPAYGRALAGAFPDAQFTIIADAGHLPHLEQPAATFDALDSYLRAVDGICHPGRRPAWLDETRADC